MEALAAHDVVALAVVVLGARRSGAELGRQRAELAEAVLLVAQQVRDGRDQPLVALGEVGRLQIRRLGRRPGVALRVPGRTRRWMNHSSRYQWRQPSWAPWLHGSQALQYN